MHRLAFKMKLHEGQGAEYKRRHDALWPELRDLLKNTGISNYSIFLDEETNILFGVLNVDEATALDDLPKNPVMRKWWTYMKDLMVCNSDHSPVSVLLKEVFYLE